MFLNPEHEHMVISVKYYFLDGTYTFFRKVKPEVCDFPHFQGQSHALKSPAVNWYEQYDCPLKAAMDLTFHDKPSEGLSFVRTEITAQQNKVLLYSTEDPI